MTWRFDRPLRVGKVRCVALCETAVTAHSVGQVVAATGTKRPLLVFFIEGERISAMDMSGAALDPVTIEARFPTAIAQARAAFATELSGRAGLTDRL